MSETADGGAATARPDAGTRWRPPRVERVVRKAISFAAALGTMLGVLHGLAGWWGRDADALYDGERGAQVALAEGVSRWVDESLSREDFATGSSRYDGEWLFMTRMFAALGYAQVVMEHPELLDRYAPRMDACLDAMITREARAFDREAWGTDPFEDIGTGRAHVGYLGYLAIAIAAVEHVHPRTSHAPLLDRIVLHLAPLFDASATGLLETYPGEVYPIDNTAFFGALGLRQRTRRAAHHALLARAASLLRGRHRDPESGLLFQSVSPHPQAPQRIGRPRASGTGLAAYFLSFADPALSAELYRAIRRQTRRTVGFGTTREYAGDALFDDAGDVDSGPVILGQGVSATGFTLALARVHGDRETFEATWATASAIGGAVDTSGRHFALGGPIGDALLFALSTAPPRARWAARGRR